LIPLQLIIPLELIRVELILTVSIKRCTHHLQKNTTHNNLTQPTSMTLMLMKTTLSAVVIMLTLHTGLRDVHLNNIKQHQQLLVIITACVRHNKAQMWHGGGQWRRHHAQIGVTPGGGARPKGLG